MTIRRHAMLAGGETVLVAVSGGADSVALFEVMRRLAPELRLRLHVAHVDHRLRPDSSEDARFVREMAEAAGVGVDVTAVDVPLGGNLEERARRARYRALDEIADRIRAERIAVGHTADDQAETVLMRLTQGAGPRGLAGIPAVRGRVVRPLLEARRDDVLALLRAEGLAWREDPSNEARRFLRNRIRHEILPTLGDIAPDIVGALQRTARLARETVAALEAVAARELAAAATVEPDAITLPVERLRALPPPISAEVLRQAAARLGSRAPLRAWTHRGLARIAVVPAPRRPFRIGGLTVEVSGARVRLGRTRRDALRARALAVPGVTTLDEVGLVLEARLLDAADYEIPRAPDHVAFDAERLEGTLRIRPRAAGDRFVPFGGGERKVKDLLIGAKVPRWERDAIPLVEAGDRIVWVAGVRRGDAAPVTARTRTVLDLRLRPASGVLADDRADQ